MGFVAESRWDSRRGFGLFIAYCSRCHCSKTVGPVAHRQPSTRNQQPPHPPSGNPEVGSALQPRVARFPALPWVRVAESQQPQRGCAEATSGHLAPHRPSSETDPSQENGQRLRPPPGTPKRGMPLCNLTISLSGLFAGTLSMLSTPLVKFHLQSSYA